MRGPLSPGGRDLRGASDSNQVFIPPPSSPVGGRLLDFSLQWCHITSDSWVLQTVSLGYQLEFTSTPPSHPPQRVTPVPADPARRSALEKEILSLREKKAISVLPPGSASRFTSTFFLASKKTGDWRPIINLRPLNFYIKPKHFRMESLSTVLQSLPTGWWATSIDLKDAYLHVPIHIGHREFLQFIYRGTTYQFRCLPFGLSTAPRVFTRVTKVIAAFLRQRHVHLFMYLDDWLILGPTSQDTLLALQQTVDLTLRLGFIINTAKSSLTPSQQPIYLGAVLNLATGKATPTLDRCLALQGCIQVFMAASFLPARMWLRLLGMMASLIDLVPWCRMHMRPLQLHLLYHFHPSMDPISKEVPVTQLIRNLLRWWLDRDNLLSGVQFPRPSPSLTLTTDASERGWGAHLRGQSVAGTWSPQQGQLHINLLELLAVFKALQSFESLVCNQRVLVKTDNSTVVSYINRQGGTHSPSLCLATWDLLSWCVPRQVSLQAIHLAGKKNSLADALSRGKVVPTEWSLHPVVVKHVFNILGTPHVDLFASHLNHQLPTFCSRHNHPEAWRVDALSFDWTGIHAYAFPPISLLQRVLTKIETESSRVILIAPLLAETVMVHTSVEPACSLPSQTPRASGSFLSAKVSDSASGPSLSSSVCLDAVKVSLRAAGLSKDATALAAKSRRESTRRSYDSRLLHFTKWCKERALDPHSASITAIGDFLLHLFNSGLQISTVKGYRSAIGAIHTGFQDGSTVSSSTPLSHLIRGMFLERPPTRKLVPSWDLGSVLSSLSRSPFEPASDSSLHNLTIKTAFLLAVATARRRSELHALTLEPGHIRWEPGGVRLIPHLQFLTKNQSINFSPPDIFVPSLTAFSSVAEDKWWCSVRALKYYIARTQPMRGDVKQLFITTIQPHRPASVTTMARWISEAIVSPVTDNRGSKSQAHETRSVSTSWAHLLGVSIPDIMEAACWKNPTTFTSCYLKDVVQAEGLVGRKVLQEVG